MSVRLVEAALKPGGWRAIEAVLSALPGPLVEDVQSDLVDGVAPRARSALHRAPPEVGRSWEVRTQGGRREKSHPLVLRLGI